MRIIFLFVIFSVILVGPGGAKGEERMSEMEWDIDYPFNDLNPNGDPLETTDPTLCEEKCAITPECKAWTYIKPNTAKGPLPLCFLKEKFEDEKRKKCEHCVSGKKLAPQKIN